MRIKASIKNILSLFLITLHPMAKSGDTSQTGDLTGKEDIKKFSSPTSSAESIENAEYTSQDLTGLAQPIVNNIDDDSFPSDSGEKNPHTYHPNPDNENYKIQPIQETTTSQTESINPLDKLITNPYMNNPLHAESNQIDYFEINKMNPSILIERIWEIFDSYITQDEIPEDIFIKERESFVKNILEWFYSPTVQAIGTGIAGDTIFELLKAVLLQLKKKSPKKIKPKYKITINEFDAIRETVREFEKNQLPLRVGMISKATNISPEKVRNWFKFFGCTHFSNCCWVFKW
jgi:hypothetical protein